MKPTNLLNELLSAGADDREARELADLAANLSDLRGAEPQLAHGRQRAWWRRPLRLGSLLGTAAMGLVAGTAVVALAQTSLPGNVLYPVKLTSEHLTAMAQPDYQNIIMMHRAQEVKALVADKQSDRLVARTLAEYETDMQDVKAKNYAALDYCDSSLTQAETLATPTEKSRIAAVLVELDRDRD